MAAHGSALHLARPPRSRPRGLGRGLVARRSLFARLSAIPAGGVGLVCGLPGSGKTVLVESWLEAAGLVDRAAVVSVERGERDPQRFWLTAIDALAGTAGADDRVAR